MRDHEIKDILSHLNDFSTKVASEVNNVYSTGNTFPGHRHLSSRNKIESYDFTGAVQFILLNDEGENAVIKDNYVIRPLTVDLEGKDLTQIAEAINQHYSFGSPQVKISDKIDDVQLIPIADDNGTFAVNIQIENAKTSSNITIEDISVLYDNDNKILSTDNSDINISACLL